jgi:glycerol uptake facilitator-like aquaporin
MSLLIQSTLSFSIQVPHYLGAQYLGAFAASGVVFLAYWDALVWLVELIFNTFLIKSFRYEHDRAVYRSIPETSGIFSTFPSTHLSFFGGIFDQFLGTFLLLVCICAITDKRNMQVIRN